MRLTGIPVHLATISAISASVTCSPQQGHALLLNFLQVGFFLFSLPLHGFEATILELGRFVEVVGPFGLLNLQMQLIFFFFSGC